MEGSARLDARGSMLRDASSALTMYDPGHDQADHRLYDRDQILRSHYGAITFAFLRALLHVGANNDDQCAVA